jgi:hypothetical protein
MKLVLAQRVYRDKHLFFRRQGNAGWANGGRPQWGDFDSLKAIPATDFAAGAGVISSAPYQYVICARFRYRRAIALTRCVYLKRANLPSPVWANSVREFRPQHRQEKNFFTFW